MPDIGPEWDVVDQASFESFPASDPPGWGSWRAAPSSATTSTAPASPRRVRRRGVLADTRLVAIGLGIVAAMWLGARAASLSRRA